MDSIIVQSSTHDYEVVFKVGIRHELSGYIAEYSTVHIITDETVAELYLSDIVQSIDQTHQYSTSIVPAGEASKSMEQYRYLLDRCIEAELDRDSLIIALGGGMVGDLAGFVASTYLRGIDFIQMPTSILAHDSSVGGKVAINHLKGKNLIGSFYNPKMVIYDIETLATLPASEVRSGYGEVIKHAFLSDEAWVKDILKEKLSSIAPEKLSENLMKGIRVKADIVEMDEREQGVRKHLNLGHTLAHAIEAELGYGRITHGEAVALGVCFAMKLSENKNGISLPVEDYVNWMKENRYPFSPLTELDPSKLIERMKWDKKAKNQVIHYVILKKIGEPEVVPMTNEELKEQLNRFFSEVILP